LSIGASLGIVGAFWKAVDVHFLCHCRKENEPKEKASQNNASARSAGSYAFVDAPHHRKS
jgi:hypothetical protein